MTTSFPDPQHASFAARVAFAPSGAREWTANEDEAGEHHGAVRLNEKIPPATAQLAPGEVLSLPRALAMANYQNERLALSGEDYVQSLIERDRSASKLLPTIGIGGSSARAGPASRNRAVRRKRSVPSNAPPRCGKVRSSKRCARSRWTS